MRMPRSILCIVCRSYGGHARGCPNEEWIECEGCGRELESYPCAHCIAERDKAENETTTSQGAQPMDTTTTRDLRIEYPSVRQIYVIPIGRATTTRQAYGVYAYAPGVRAFLGEYDTLEAAQNAHPAARMVESVGVAARVREAEDVYDAHDAYLLAQEFAPPPPVRVRPVPRKQAEWDVADRRFDGDGFSAEAQ